jgi:hypothetical protein
MKSHLLGLVAFVTVVLLMLSNTDGYYDYAVTVINSEQANDTYLDSLLKAAGYQGKKIDDPNPNLFESRRLEKTLEANGYAPPRSSDKYVSRSLAEGQLCWYNSDCLSKTCVNGKCSSLEDPSLAWSPPQSRDVYSNTNIIVGLAVVIMALLAVIMFIYPLRGKNWPTDTQR